MLPNRRHPGFARRGFTIIELLIVVAIFSILATIAVIAYQKYVAKARKSEVFSMIASIKSSQEAYKAETSQYVSTGSGETDYYPALGSGEPTLKAWDPDKDSKPGWLALGLSPPKSALYCGYVVVAGEANSLAGAGSRGITLFNNKAPTRPWYYIRVECDFDGDSSVNSSFETTFDNEVVFTDNEGR